jgi:demethylmenaquinone methyltransferase/2-methoxy-6-polyprenyl-1,4-benzoquinol methylase
MASMEPEKRFARALFDSIAARYERPANVLSLGQYGRWRRALVRALPLRPGALVLDVATGTGLVARDIERAHRAYVVGLDQSDEMLRAARANGGARSLAGADADALPFADATFDAVVFSYLLRYVKDPAHTVAELARTLKPGGVLASQEFGVPQNAALAAGWRAWAAGAMPFVARAFGPAWRETGEFLPRSIAAWEDAWPVERQVQAWRAAGIEDVRTKRMLFGTAVLVAGRKRR